MDELNPEKQNQEKENKHKETYIRERIVPRRDWRDYLLKLAGGGILMVILGLSIGIGIAFGAPYLQKIIGNSGNQDPKGPNETMTTPSGQPTPSVNPTPTVKPTPYVSRTSPTPKPTGTPKPTSVTPGPDATLTPTPVEGDPGNQTEKQDLNEVVNQALAQYIPGNSDLDKMNNALKRVYSGIESGFMSISYTPESDTSLELENKVYGLIVQVSGSNIFLIVDSAQITGARSITATMDGISYEAIVSCTDSITGLSLITVNAAGADIELLSSITPAVFAMGKNGGEKGDFVIAGGNPLGTAGSVQSGRVTATDSYVGAQDSYFNVIYTDILNENVNNSNVKGGFIFGVNGEVIGWIGNRFLQKEDAATLNYISSGDIVDIIDSMIQNKDCGTLGIKGQDVSGALAEKNSLVEGIYVREVVTESPAYSCGIQSGDIITGIDDQPILTMEALEKLLNEKGAGAEVSVKLMRWGRTGYVEMNVNTVLGGRIHAGQQ